MPPRDTPDALHSSPYSSSGEIVAQRVGGVYAMATQLKQIPRDRWIFAALT